MIVEETLGDAREKMKGGDSAGMTKDVYMEMKIQQAVVEADNFDLVVMGRPEGAGCYCAANTLLTQYLERLIDNYNYIVIDNEAGMEHLSRLTTKNIDILLVVSDPTRRGLQAASRIVELSSVLPLNIREKVVMVNRVKSGQEESIRKILKEYSLEMVGMVPEDPQWKSLILRENPRSSLKKKAER